MLKWVQYVSKVTNSFQVMEKRRTGLRTCGIYSHLNEFLQLLVVILTKVSDQSVVQGYLISAGIKPVTFQGGLSHHCLPPFRHRRPSLEASWESHKICWKLRKCTSTSQRGYSSGLHTSIQTFKYIWAFWPDHLTFDAIVMVCLTEPKHTAWAVPWASLRFLKHSHAHTHVHRVIQTHTCKHANACAYTHTHSISMR